MTENSSAERLELLLKAYELLSDITPKKYDCGILCSSVCCKNNGSHGNDKECGMLLLPGEKELLSGAPDYTFLNSANETLLVCDGKCIRELRPFACRIFPFYPKIVDCSGKYSVRILPDPRSFNICPITNDFRKRKARLSGALFALLRIINFILSIDVAFDARFKIRSSEFHRCFILSLL